MQKKDFSVEVIVNGKPVDEYLHNGKTYIEGKEKTEFSLRFRNHSGRQALFVPTVDGLSILDGKEASFNSRGYIIGAYSAETIDGWRTSDQEVAKFFFSRIADSYAAKSGNGGNQGVIGCAVFEEHVREPEIVIIKRRSVGPSWPYHFDGQTTITCSTASLSTSNSNTSLGTGWGDQKYSPVQTVEFDRRDNPSAVFEIFYNTRKNLESKGVVFKRALNVTPSPFPRENDYCEPPRN